MHSSSQTASQRQANTLRLLPLQNFSPAGCMPKPMFPMLVHILITVLLASTAPAAPPIIPSQSLVPSQAPLSKTRSSLSIPAAVRQNGKRYCSDDVTVEASVVICPCTSSGRPGSDAAREYLTRQRTASGFITASAGAKAINTCIGLFGAVDCIDSDASLRKEGNGICLRYDGTNQKHGFRRKQASRRFM